MLNAALTNRPALHNLAEVVATSSQFAHYLEPNEDNSKMKELLIKLFALSATATDAEIEAELTALSAAKGDSKVALKDVYAALKNSETEKVALSAAEIATAKTFGLTPDLKMSRLVYLSRLCSKPVKVRRNCLMT